MNICYICGANHYRDKPVSLPDGAPLGPFTWSVNLQTNNTTLSIQEVWQGRPIAPVHAQSKPLQSVTIKQTPKEQKRAAVISHLEELHQRIDSLKNDSTPEGQALLKETSMEYASYAVSNMFVTGPKSLFYDSDY